MYRSNSQIQFNNNANYWTGHGKNTYVGDKVVEIRDEEEQYQADKKRWELPQFVKGSRN